MKLNTKTVAIVVAAGSGSRMNNKTPKQFLRIGDKPILFYTLNKFELSDSIYQVILVVQAEDTIFAAEEIVERYSLHKVNQIVEGGRERQDSVFAGLKAVQNNTEIVLIHDGVRPFIQPGLIERGIQSCREYGAVVTAIPVSATVKCAKENIITKTIDRDELWEIQTPQIFRFDLIFNAYQSAAADNYAATDDAMILERLGEKVHLIMGDKQNIKITTQEDLEYAEFLIRTGKW